MSCHHWVLLFILDSKIFWMFVKNNDYIFPIAILIEIISSVVFQNIAIRKVFSSRNLPPKRSVQSSWFITIFWTKPSSNIFIKDTSTMYLGWRKSAFKHGWWTCWQILFQISFLGLLQTHNVLLKSCWKLTVNWFHLTVTDFAVPGFLPSFLYIFGSKRKCFCFPDSHYSTCCSLYCM